MKVNIIVDGVEREFQGYYEELHARDWGERVRDMLDSAHEYEQEELTDTKHQ